jgi:hypothetical protein
VPVLPVNRGTSAVWGTLQYVCKNIHHQLLPAASHNSARTRPKYNIIHNDESISIITTQPTLKHCVALCSHHGGEGTRLTNPHTISDQISNHNEMKRAEFPAQVPQ